MAYNSGFVNSRYQTLMRRQPRQNGFAFRQSVIQNPKCQLVPSIWSISCTRAQRFSRIQSGASTWVKGVSTYKCPATDPTWASWLGTEHIVVLIYLRMLFSPFLYLFFFFFPRHRSANSARFRTKCERLFSREARKGELYHHSFGEFPQQRLAETVYGDT